LNVPSNDRFQVITEHPAEGFVFDPNCLGIQRSEDGIFVQVTLNEGRTVEQKKRFYKAVDGLEKRLGLRRELVANGSFLAWDRARPVAPLRPRALSIPS
jgi:4-oxalocrotonate tautomerase